MLEPRFVQPKLFNAPSSPAEPSPTLNILLPENNLLAQARLDNALDNPIHEESNASAPDDVSRNDRSSSRNTNQTNLSNHSHYSGFTQPNQVLINQPSEPNAIGDELEVSDSPDDRLDASSLNTVLDMLVVIDTIEELTLLETLTDIQKRQVWDATPEEVRTKLKQLRASATANPPAQPNPPVEQEPPTPEKTRSQPLPEPDDFESADEYLDEWDAEAAIEQDSYPLESPYSTHRPTLMPGDWVVLHANSRLSTAELEAIWEVVEVHQNIARIQTKGVGTRNYPIAWMVLYPKPKFD
ncbi:hypothetical protein C7B61_14745 [filamentous cyanobacterium CCP1]|nr:hypothetical protein C7B76_26320 [filamentous cyanobacterium CCP2]PSB62280.1 hypothetical protein C7B61_14745 [filamentous cyanobacterium CCP1]